MAEGGSDAFDPVDFRLKRLEGDMAEVKGDIKALRGEVLADIGALREEIRSDIGMLRDEMRAGFASSRGELGSLREDVSYLRGRLDYMPTTIQLLGFIIAIFVASGITRYFGH